MGEMLHHAKEKEHVNTKKQNLIQNSTLNVRTHSRRENGKQ